MQIISFCVEPGINLDISSRLRRARLISSTVGQRQLIDNQIKYRTFIFYPVIDCILIEIEDRFSNKKKS